MSVKAVTDADAAAKTMATIVTDGGAMTKAINAAVKADPPSVAGIRKETVAGETAVNTWSKSVADAKKKLVDVEKLKEAEAKTAAAKLKDGVAKAEKAIIAVKGTIDIAEKIADKAAKEDTAIGAELLRISKAAEASCDTINSFIIGGPGQAQLLTQNLAQVIAKKLPLQALTNSIPVVAKNLKEVGSDITTATSVHSSLGPIIKKAEEAFLPTVRADAKDAVVLGKKLADLIAKARTMQAAGLKQINDIQAKVKTLA